MFSWNEYRQLLKAYFQNWAITKGSLCCCCSDHYMKWTQIYIAGGTCDGQYIKSMQFYEQMKKRICVGSSKSKFALPISWDPAHFIHLAFSDIMDGKGSYKSSSKFLQRVIGRTKVFAQEMHIGKGEATRHALSMKFAEKSNVISAYAQQR